ncbi:hypothetical protein DVH05_006100 [Phytophthora capsici]|nr:hypothetical protein DVH05_006100 [Phytophthora capsici]
MEWCVAIRCISECSASLRGRGGGFNDALRVLLGYVDHVDVLVVYTAKEELRKAFADGIIEDTQCVNSVVIALLGSSSSEWRREASGFRLQLLQILVNVATGVQVLLKNLEKVKTMVHSIFMPRRCSESGDPEAIETVPYSVQYEALAFLSEFVRCLDTMEIETSDEVALSELITLLVGEVFVTMDYVSQPAFVSCAVLRLVGDFQHLVKFWMDQKQNDNGDSLVDQYSKWLESCLVWLTQSTCALNALRLLNDEQVSNLASQEAFIAKSSRYPLLQQWFLCLSRMGVTYVEALTAKPKNYLDVLQSARISGQPQYLQRLPTRQQLFVVLAEQDDIMIEVLTGITRSIALLESANGIHSVFSQQFLSLSAYMATEYDPDLLFANLVATLGQDHLVVLDLLVSNETQMLEYLMRYTRRLSANWNTSKSKLETGDQLDSVMSVLIRLRLEIDRLVAADLFPYSVGPLTRRLLAIEHLYEDEDAG